MPSNKELIDKIAGLAEKADVSAPDTADKSNKELDAIAKQLQADIERKEADAAEAEALEAKEAAKGRVYVARGRSVTSPEGIKGPGALIRDGLIPAADVSRLLKKKVLIRK